MEKTQTPVGLPKGYNYEPLNSDLVRIGFSAIHGHGIFAKDYIPPGVDIGISHYVLVDRMIRTPLGGFLNHEDKPNCMLIKDSDEVKSGVVTISIKCYTVHTMRFIEAGQELTLNYNREDCGDVKNCERV